MNILGFSNDTGSRQWRMQGIANYLNIRTEHEYFVTSHKDWNSNIVGADIVVAQMWRNPKGIDVIHRAGAKAVYEADDIIIGVGGQGRKMLMDLDEKQTKQTADTIKKCDLVTVTTEVIAEHYRQYNDNVIVLPNYLDFMWWGKPWKAKSYNQVRIGWMGSKSHREDLMMIEPVIKRVLDEFDFVKFVYCGFGGTKNLYGERLFKSIPANRKEYYVGVPLENWAEKSKSLGIDIGISPLLDDEFNAGKSPIKYFEYSANGVPGVYSDTIVYNDTVKQGKTGFLANNPDQWYNYLEKLILNDKIHNSIAQASYNDVLDNHSLADNYDKWIKAYESVL